MSPGARNFAVVWVSNFITAVGMMSFIPLIPRYLVDLGVSGDDAVLRWSGILVAAAPLPAAFMGPVWGALGDRLGRKLMVVRANVAICVFVGSMGLVATPWQMLALRLGQGVFSGFIAPAMTLVSVATPEHRQARTAANLQTAVIAGMIVGPVMGGWVADALGYRVVFAVCSALSLLAMLLVMIFVREPDEARETSSARPVALMRSVLKDVLAFLSIPALRGILLGVFAVRFGASLIEPILAPYVDTMKGLDPSRAGTITGAVVGVQAVATLIFTPFWGRFGDRHGHRRTLAACALGGAAFSLGQAFVGHVGWLFSLRFLAGVFVAGIVPAAFASAARHSPVHRRGGAYGVTFSSLVLARALAPWGGGELAAHVGLAPLFVVSAVLMGAAALAAMRSASHAPPQA